MEPQQCLARIDQDQRQETNCLLANLCTELANSGTDCNKWLKQYALIKGSTMLQYFGYDLQDGFPDNFINHCAPLDCQEAWGVQSPPWHHVGPMIHPTGNPYGRIMPISYHCQMPRKDQCTRLAYKNVPVWFYHVDLVALVLPYTVAIDNSAQLLAMPPFMIAYVDIGEMSNLRDESITRDTIDVKVESVSISI